MPVYEYKCKTCGKEFEISQKITDEPLTHCPEGVCECEIKGQGEVFRKISKGIGLVFNGKGFYLTDYAHKNGSMAHSSHEKNGADGNPKVDCSKCPAAKAATDAAV